MPSGPGIWGFRTRFNTETVGAQSQGRVRERTVTIEYYFHLKFVIYLCLASHKFKCNFKLILLSTEDGLWATETCLVNLIFKCVVFSIKAYVYR